MKLNSTLAEPALCKQETYPTGTHGSKIGIARDGRLSPIKQSDPFHCEDLVLDLSFQFYSTNHALIIKTINKETDTGRA